MSVITSAFLVHSISFSFSGSLKQSLVFVTTTFNSKSDWAGYINAVLSFRFILNVTNC
uniref:Uncharacterized protein n=1 Tax=Rhizophora mucronata TaxID=61149 RepID=A0A2P2N9Z7_RHIMU